MPPQRIARMAQDGRHCHVHRCAVVKRFDSFERFAGCAALQRAIGATDGDASGQAVKPLS
jgi:hypothetical protein